MITATSEILGLQANTNDKIYNQLVDDLFIAAGKEVGMVLGGVVPKGTAPLYIYILSHPDNYN